jgi:hypothetical protein
MDRPTETRIAILCLAFLVAIALSPRAGATTEEEAVDELIAVLGVTLPCQQYAIAWLDDTAGRIEHRCSTAPVNADFPTDQLDSQRVYYSLDIRAARNRFAKVYRSRGTPTPSLVLAQFLQSLAVLADSGGSQERHFAPLVVYSRKATPPTATPLAVRQRPVAQDAMVFSP